VPGGSYSGGYNSVPPPLPGGVPGGSYNGGHSSLPPPLPGGAPGGSHNGGYGSLPPPLPGGVPGGGYSGTLMPMPFGTPVGGYSGAAPPMGGVGGISAHEVNAIISAKLEGFQKEQQTLLNSFLEKMTSMMGSSVTGSQPSSPTPPLSSAPTSPSPTVGPPPPLASPPVPDPVGHSPPPAGPTTPRPGPPAPALGAPPPRHVVVPRRHRGLAPTSSGGYKLSGGRLRLPDASTALVATGEHSLGRITFGTWAEPPALPQQPVQKDDPTGGVVVDAVLLAYARSYNADIFAKAAATARAAVDCVLPPTIPSRDAYRVAMVIGMLFGPEHTGEVQTLTPQANARALQAVLHIALCKTAWRADVDGHACADMKLRRHMTEQRDAQPILPDRRSAALIRRSGGQWLLMLNSDLLAVGASVTSGHVLRGVQIFNPSAAVPLQFVPTPADARSNGYVNNLTALIPPDVVEVVPLCNAPPLTMEQMRQRTAELKGEGGKAWARKVAAALQIPLDAATTSTTLPAAAVPAAAVLAPPPTAALEKNASGAEGMEERRHSVLQTEGGGAEGSPEGGGSTEGDGGEDGGGPPGARAPAERAGVPRNGEFAHRRRRARQDDRGGGGTGTGVRRC
jgi:hypothetical protein